jgi:hypothetical protein
MFTWCVSWLMKTKVETNTNRTEVSEVQSKANPYNLQDAPKVRSPSILVVVVGSQFFPVIRQHQIWVRYTTN